MRIEKLAIKIFTCFDVKGLCLKKLFHIHKEMTVPSYGYIVTVKNLLFMDYGEIKSLMIYQYLKSFLFLIQSFLQRNGHFNIL